VRRRRAD